MAPKKVAPRGKGASAPKKKTATPQGAKKASAPKKTTTGSAKGTRFVRAIYGSEARVSLDNGLVIHLKPRGQVGDMAPVDEDDRADQKYSLNKDLLFEEISAAEAKKILDKQATNAQAPRPDPTMEMLRNELGKPYEQGKPVVDIPYEEQGTVVANIDTDQTQQPRYQEQITRPAMAPQQVDVPGSVGNPGPEIPADVPPEQAADWLARNTNDEGSAADALRGSLKTTVGPTQRDINPAQRRAPVHPDDVGQ